MSIRLIAVINMKCDNCTYQDRKIDLSASPFHSSYNLIGFCHKYSAWVTLLKDKEFHILICEE